MAEASLVPALSKKGRGCEAIIEQDLPLEQILRPLVGMV